MKKLFAVIGFSLALGLQAEVVTYTINTTSGANAQNLIDGPIRLLSLELINGGVGAVKFKIFDSPNTNSTRGPVQGYDLVSYSNGVYTTYSSYITNWTRTVTNFSGLITNETRVGVYNYAVTNAATTNSYTAKYSGVLPTVVGSSISLVPSGSAPVYFGKGLTITNDAVATNVSVIIEYLPAR